MDRNDIPSQNDIESKKHPSVLVPLSESGYDSNEIANTDMATIAGIESLMRLYRCLWKCATPTERSGDTALADEGVPNSPRKPLRGGVHPFLQQLLVQSCQVQPWVEDTYEVVKTLEEASRNQGRVDMMRRIEDGHMVAVKRMPTQWVTHSPVEFRMRHPASSERPWIDIVIVKHLNNVGYPYVCELLGVYDDGMNTYVVSSLADKDLYRWSSTAPVPGPEREAVAQPIAAQVFAAVKWLHNLGIAHRDISLENVLVDANGKVRLIDFGMATIDPSSVTPCGKRVYKAPEMHVGVCDPFVADVFAAGVLLYGMTTQDYPWGTTKVGKKSENCPRFTVVRKQGFRALLEQHRVLSKTDGLPFSEVLSEDLISLLEGVLSIQPLTRWTLGETCWENIEPPRMSVWRSKWFGEHSKVLKLETRWRLNQRRNFAAC
eukprot:TRINITY_DN2998_c0_g2_i1.p1 TRINITY_DN2998_c0_g2~~TRINITY_DN2998_c0_g2_i1.p1  ORF type:complete len:432 (+),score=71.56 TRINITY_DN2998_c0_g2_i1:71-1366(+)